MLYVLLFFKPQELVHFQKYRTFWKWRLTHYICRESEEQLCHGIAVGSAGSLDLRYDLSGTYFLRVPEKQNVQCHWTWLLLFRLHALIPTFNFIIASFPYAFLDGSCVGRSSKLARTLTHIVIIPCLQWHGQKQWPQLQLQLGLLQHWHACQWPTQTHILSALQLRQACLEHTLTTAVLLMALGLAAQPKPQESRADSKHQTAAKAPVRIYIGSFARTGLRDICKFERKTLQKFPSTTPEHNITASPAVSR